MAERRYECYNPEGCYTAKIATPQRLLHRKDCYTASTARSREPERGRSGGTRMSLTPRKAASLLGAAALAVTAMAGAARAGVASPARASVPKPSFSKLSP